MNICLRTIRLKLNLSQRKTAEMANISQNYYSNIENGNRRPSPQVAKRIAEILGFKDEWYKLLEVTADSA